MFDKNFKKLPISCFIICHNEEERIRYTLESVHELVDEIIIVDSGSTDATLKIAREYTDKIFHNDWNGFGQQKIFAESKCRNQWLLNLDADEALSYELQEELRSLFSSYNSLKPEYKAVDGFEINWKMIFIGQEKPASIATGGRVLRLYNREKAGFREDNIHDSVIAKDNSNSDRSLNLKLLKNPIHHRCFKDYTHWINKINFYTSEQAAQWLAKGRKKPSLARLICEPPLSFFKCYFQRKYIFYGIDGFYAALIYSFSKTLRLAKIRHLLKNKKL